MNAMSGKPTPKGTVGTAQSHRPGTTVLEDGSMVISEEQLRKFGNGDAAFGRRELRLLLELDSDNAVPSGPTERPASVRIAGPADEDALLELWLQDLRANAEHVAPIDEAKVLENIRAGTRGRGGVTACIDGPDGPVAMVVLHPMEWHWSRGSFFQEMCSYVHVDHRKSRHASDLLNFSKWSAEGMSRNMGSAFHVLVGVLGAWRVRAKIALYRRMFPQVGSCHIWPPVPRRGN